VFSQSRALIQSVTEFHESVKSDAKQLPVLLVLQSLSNEEKEEIESALDVRYLKEGFINLATS